jgi:hypothetical protein
VSVLLPVSFLKETILKLRNEIMKIYKIVILPDVLDEHESWSLILGEEHKLRMLTRIFGPTREEVRKGWRKLHDPLFHNL